MFKIELPGAIEGLQVRSSIISVERLSVGNVRNTVDRVPRFQILSNATRISLFVSKTVYYDLAVLASIKNFEIRPTERAHIPGLQ